VASVAENIASYGLAGRLVSIDQMAVERGAFLDRGFEDETTRATVVEAFRSAARQGVAKGAETVIPAGGIVMALLALANVAYLEEAPRVGPQHTGVCDAGCGRPLERAASPYRLQR